MVNQNRNYQNIIENTYMAAGVTVMTLASMIVNVEAIMDHQAHALTEHRSHSHVAASEHGRRQVSERPVRGHDRDKLRHHTVHYGAATLSEPTAGSI